MFEGFSLASLTNEMLIDRFELSIAALDPWFALYIAASANEGNVT